MKSGFLPEDLLPGRAQAGSFGAASMKTPMTLRGLFETHYASVWRLLRRLGVPSGQLDDAAQEVFWVAARRLADIERGREHAFLYGVALRIASNWHRAQRGAPALTEDDPSLFEHTGLSPEQLLEARRARELLDAVLDQMPHELRVAFVLFELEGLLVKEIAELENLPVGTAASRLRRAREEFSAIARRLRASLEGRRAT